MATILLVENDPLYALLRKSLLEGQFFDVRRVGDAAEALCLVEEAKFAGNLGLVISGHHGAGFGGPEFVAELHSRMPSLPVLVLGSGSEAAGDYTGEGVRFIAKPVASREMLALAGQMLAQRQPSVA